MKKYQYLNRVLDTIIGVIVALMVFFIIDAVPTYAARITGYDDWGDGCKSCTHTIREYRYGDVWTEWCQNCCSWEKYDNNPAYKDTRKQIVYFGYYCTPQGRWYETGYDELNNCPECGEFYLSDSPRWMSLKPNWHTMGGYTRGQDTTHYWCAGHAHYAYMMNVSGDSHVTGISGGGEFDQNTTSTLRASFATGYQFAYMQDRNNGARYYNNPENWTMNTDRNVYVVSKPISYNQKIYVRYQNPDGTWGNYQNVLNQNYDYGSTVSWSRAEDGNFAWAGLSYTVTGNSTKYVDVSRKQSQFVIDSSHGTFDIYINGTLVGDNVSSITQTVLNGSSFEITDVKPEIGYTFDGITGTTTETSGSVTGSTDLTLNYHLNSYTVHFETVGGVNGPADVKLNYGQEYKLTVTPTRTGYSFKIWSTIADGTGTMISAADTIKNLTGVDHATITLYANWTQKKFQVVKSASSWHGGTFVRRTPGDETWYDSVGKLGIDEELLQDQIVQEWAIHPDGTMEQVR